MKALVSLTAAEGTLINQLETDEVDTALWGFIKLIKSCVFSSRFQVHLTVLRNT